MLKLKYAGLTESAISWFKSYLTNRMQVTKIDQVLSTPAPVKHGVLQGSKLGPLLFIIFVNDIPDYITVGDTFLYADDTAIRIEGRRQEDVEAQLSIALQQSMTWMNKNKLTMNTSKTKAMFFGTTYTTSQLKDPDMHSANVNIEVVENYKYLIII